MENRRKRKREKGKKKAEREKNEGDVCFFGFLLKII